MLNGAQVIGFKNGYYNASATLNHENMTYTVFAGGGYLGPISTETTSMAHYNLPSGQIVRTSESESRAKSNSQYGQFRLRYQKGQTSLTSYMGLSRSASPHGEAWGRIWEGDDVKESSSTNKSRGLSPSLSINGEHSWRDSHRLTFSLGGSYSHNKYDRSYMENGFNTLTNSKEDAFSVNSRINYSFYKKKWSLTAMAMFEGNLYDSEYSGSYDTKEHLWQHDLVSYLVFYYYPSSRLGLNIAGGLHWQMTDLRNWKRFMPVFPRAQFNLQYRTKRGMLMWQAALNSATYSPSVINDTRIDVNPYLVKVGNPNIRRAYSISSNLYYKGQFGKLKLSFSTNHEYDVNYMITDYYPENDKIVQSYVWNGRVYTGSAYAGVTYSFSDNFEVNGSATFSHTSVNANIDRHHNSVTGMAMLKWYIKDFSISPYIASYSKGLNYTSLSYSSFPMNYGLQATYSHKDLYVALSCVMPFDKLKSKN